MKYIIMAFGILVFMIGLWGGFYIVETYFNVHSVFAIPARMTVILIVMSGAILFGVGIAYKEPPK